MTTRLFGVAAAIYTLAWLPILATRATTVVPPTFEEMTDRADLIFVGRATDSRSEWRTVGTNRVIFTLTTFETQDVLKGKKAPFVRLQFLGGTVGGEGFDVVGVPKFSVGESVILFVERNGVQFCPIVGVFHGKFGVHKDEKTGREIVCMHDGKPLHDVKEIGTGEGAELRLKQSKPSISTDREPLSVDDFKRCIRLHFAK